MHRQPAQPQNCKDVEPGQEIGDPALVLDFHEGDVLMPDAADPAAMGAVPPWARPIVEAALKLAHG
ncbi:MAG: hypothetical protein ACYC0T_16840 [Ramlibacter sp.]